MPEVVQRALEDDLGRLGRVRIIEAQVLVVDFVQSLLGTCLEDPKAQVNGESLAVDGFADDPLRVRVILVRPVDPDDGALFVQQLPANGDGGKGDGKSAENPRVFPSRAGRMLHSPSWGASKRDAVSRSGGAGTAGAHHRFAMPIAIHPLFHRRSTHVTRGLGDASPSGAGEVQDFGGGVHRLECQNFSSAASQTGRCCRLLEPWMRIKSSCPPPHFPRHPAPDTRHEPT